MYIVGTPENIVGLVVLEDRERLLDLEAGEQHLLDAEPDAEEHHARQPVDVEEGQRADALAARELVRVLDEHVDGLLYVRDQVAVGKHRALRDPRRAPRVLQRRHVLGRIYLHVRCGVGVRREEVPEGVVSGVQAFRFVPEVHDDDGLQVRVGQHGLHPLVHGGVDDDRFCVRSRSGCVRSRVPRTWG